MGLGNKITVDKKTKPEKKKGKMGYGYFGKDCATDLMELYLFAQKRLKGIKITLVTHPIVKKEPQCKKLIGYYPSGDNQILFEKDKKVISCIRGAVSFGYYELWGIENIDTGEPKRFDNLEEVIKWIKKQNL